MGSKLAAERKAIACTVMEFIEGEGADQHRASHQEAKKHTRARQSVDFGVRIAGCFEIHHTTSRSMYSSKLLVTDFYGVVDFEVLR
jgi:hypothetical protein